MKDLRILLLTIVMSMSYVNSIFLQRTCATHELYEISNQNSDIKSKRQKLERFTEQFKKSNSSNRSSTVYTIKVAVHVVMNDPSIITNSQIESQINVLTQDFRKLNLDLSSVPSEFETLTSDTQFEFVLANVGPDCNGITRTVNNTSCFVYTSNDVKSTAAGGHDPIDPEHILNIWVAPLCGPILGYATFPGEPLATDGVVIHPMGFGVNGTSQGPYNLGRTATHEVGHYFNLRHIWGDEPDCTGTDFCDDTPNQANFNFGCPSFPNISCSNGPFGDMFMNFMDYVDDYCMHMFTPNQSTRMQAALLGARSGLIELSFEEICCSIKNLKPNLSISSVSNQCGTNAINLNQYHIGQVPAEATLIWSTDNNPNDGVDPKLNGNVNSSGTYFSYYHFSSGNCFGLASNPINVTISDKTQKPDDNITTNTYITGIHSYWGNIIVNNGATLHIHLADLTFLQGKGIIVKNGGRLILQGTTIDVCDPSLSWSGIKIESGGFFDTDDTYLYNVANGIDAKSNSTLQIYNLTIDGKGTSTGIGINLDGKVNDDFINKINISNFQYGLYANEGNSYYGITGGRITNVQYGVFLLASPAVVSGIYMHNVDYGIWSMSSPGSMFLGNEIYHYNSGILSYLSQNTLIEGNYIGQPKSTGKVGVLMFLSPQSDIQDNTHIEGITVGVSSWASPGAIARNSIEVIGNNNSSGGGVINLYSSGSQIIDNSIYTNNSSFGIETNSCDGTEVKNNLTAVSSNVSEVRSAAIRSVGGTGEIIEDNRAEGIENATGILIQNAGMNTIKCNDVISPDEGLGMYIASDEQGIIGNELTGAQDLTIRSVVGVQNHEGNKFYGGNATAIGLTNEELVLSRFYVNGSIPYHMPANPDPGGDQWFKSKAESDYQCSGTSGPGWLPFQGGDPNEICKYWLYLKSIKNTKPELFFVKLYHLLKYTKSRPNFIIPNCVKIDPVFQSLCGLTKLVDINAALLSIGKNSVNTSNLETYQQNYILQSSEQGKLAAINQLKAEMANIKPQLDANAVNNSSRLDSIKNELNLLNCNEVIVLKWKEIMKLYVDFLKAREVSQENRAATLAYSAECSDTFGDMIHLARAMANTFDQTNFEAFDNNCFDGSTPRTSKVDSETIKLQVYPNPSSGLVNIKMSAIFSGQIFVKTLDGKLLESKTVKDSYIEELDLSHKAGVYFVELIAINGYKTTQKVIVIE